MLIKGQGEMGGIFTALGTLRITTTVVDGGTHTCDKTI